MEVVVADEDMGRKESNARDEERRRGEVEKVVESSRGGGNGVSEEGRLGRGTHDGVDIKYDVSSRLSITVVVRISI